MAGKRILLLLGGAYHDFEGYAAALEPIVAQAGHTLEPTYDLDLLTRLGENRWDVVLSDTCTTKHREGSDEAHPERLSDAQTDPLVQWVRAGGGFIPVHAATAMGLPNPALKALMGGEFITHPPQYAFTVYPTYGEHPITAGVEAFTVHDEFYMQQYDPAVAVHMVAIDRGVAYPMVWSRSAGRGRVAHIALGHGPNVWQMAPYQRLILQAVAWVTEPREGA